MNSLTKQAFLTSWNGRCRPTYDLEMKSCSCKALAGLTQGVYALVSDDEIVFGCSTQLAVRLMSRKSTDKWASRALVFDMAGHFGSYAEREIEVTCICITARRGDSSRTLRNIRCRDSLGGFFYSATSPLVELGKEWRRSVFAYLDELDDPYRTWPR